MYYNILSANMDMEPYILNDKNMANYLKYDFTNKNSKLPTNMGTEQIEKKRIRIRIRIRIQTMIFFFQKNKIHYFGLIILFHSG